MAGTAMFTGPLPPEGESWCTICAMIWKQDGISLLDAQIKAIPDHEVEWLSLSSVRRSAPNLIIPVSAVTTGLYAPMTQLGTIPLCWSHLMGLSVTTGLLPAQAADLPPGALPRNRG
jgi:hypothetical protein